MQESLDNDLLRPIAGIVFIGTPHQGARLASASKSWWFDSSSDIRTVLELNSKVLSELDAKFSRIPPMRNREIKIVSFYEMVPTHYVSSLLPWFKMHVSILPRSQFAFTC